MKVILLPANVNSFLIAISNAFLKSISFCTPSSVFGSDNEVRSERLDRGLKEDFRRLLLGVLCVSAFKTERSPDEELKRSDAEAAEDG